MLFSFRVSNNRSIRDEQELSLHRSGRMLGAESPAESPWNPLISTVACIYGPNASGKSNFLKAMDFMSRAVRNSHAHWGPESGIERERFQLDAKCAGLPSTFEIEFSHHDIRYQYGFEIDDTRVLREWLYAYPGSRRQTWFERDANLADEQANEWYFGKSLTGQNRVISELTRPNSLFLSAAAAVKHPKLMPVYHYLTRHLRIVESDSHNSRLMYTIDLLGSQEDLGDSLKGLLRFADLGITGFTLSHEKFNGGDEERILQVIKLTTSIGSKGRGDAPSEEDLRKTIRAMPKMLLEHIGKSGEVVSLPFAAESTGTQALIALAGPMFQALRHGFVLLVDEIDTSLHPTLVSELIRLFQNPSQNPHQAQLILYES
jgi:hypothetical protein